MSEILTNLFNQNKKQTQNKETHKCKYCKKEVLSVGYICSRKACKKIRKTSNDGANNFISYDDRLIQEKLIRECR